MNTEEQKISYMELENSKDLSDVIKNKFGPIISKYGPKNTQSFTESEFDSHQRTCISFLSSEMELPENICIKILQKMGWNLEKARLEALENIDYYPPMETKEDAKNHEKEIDFKRTRECLICWEEVRSEQVVELNCSHSVCETCLKANINANFQSLSLKCPAYSCQAVIDESLVWKYLNTEHHNLYQHLKIEDSIKRAGNFNYCPSKNCQRMVQLLKMAPGAKNLQCDCGISFCSQCKELSHKPATCEMIKNWKSFMKITDDDSLTELWNEKNAKKCPFCASPIQKNGGCTHMTCKSCAHEFCWNCLEDWKAHKRDFINCSQIPKTDMDPKLIDGLLPNWENSCKDTLLNKCLRVAAT